MGISSDAGEIFVPLKELKAASGPVYFEFEGRPMKLNFSLSDLTAWVEDMQGRMIAGTLAYRYVWQAFWPKSKIQKRFSEHNPSP